VKTIFPMSVLVSMLSFKLTKSMPSADVVPLGTRCEGIEGVRNFYQLIAQAVPDLNISVTAEYNVPGCSILGSGDHGHTFGRFLGDGTDRKQGSGGTRQLLHL